jgi:hypothetical protein
MPTVTSAQDLCTQVYSLLTRAGTEHLSNAEIDTQLQALARAGTSVDPATASLIATAAAGGGASTIFTNINDVVKRCTTLGSPPPRTQPDSPSSQPTPSPSR